MSQGWAKWENQVINGVFPLHRSVSFSDHSAVFLTEHGARNLPNALLKLVPAIPTLKATQLAHWSAAATLAHPHLVPILEAGNCQLGGLQFLFVVMEYAELTLAKILTQRPLAPEALRKAMRPILAPLGFLHRNNLVHGSLKPSNVLLVNHQLKLASDTVRPTGESAANIAGSSVYDPPESRDGSFSSAGDIWSLGVIMVEALTQRRPTWPDKRSGVATLPETTPPQFADIIQQCLSRDPANRPTVAELYAQINPPEVVTVTSVRYPVLLPPAPEPAARVTDQIERADTASGNYGDPFPKRRSFLPISTAAVILLGLAWTGLQVFYSGPAPKPTAGTAASTPGAPVDASIPIPAVGPDSNTVTASTSASAPWGLPAASPDVGLPKPGTAAAQSSIVHEEAPDVPLGALVTVRGRIVFAMRVNVDRSGNVVHTTIATHSPSRYFTHVATETARKWKFAASDNQGTRQWVLWFEFTRDGATARASTPRT
jgi:hypothetical protein